MKCRDPPYVVSAYSTPIPTLKGYLWELPIFSVFTGGLGYAKEGTALDHYVIGLIMMCHSPMQSKYANFNSTMIECNYALARCCKLLESLSRKGVNDERYQIRDGSSLSLQTSLGIQKKREKEQKSG